MFIEKKKYFSPNGGVLEDWWTEQVSGVYQNLGLSQGQLQFGQSIIDKAKPLLPNGGVVPIIETGIGANQVSTGYEYGSSVSPVLLAVGAAALMFVLLRSK